MYGTMTHPHGGRGGRPMPGIPGMQSRGGEGGKTGTVMFGRAVRGRAGINAAHVVLLLVLALVSFPFSLPWS